MTTASMHHRWITVGAAGALAILLSTGCETTEPAASAAPGSTSQIGAGVEAATALPVAETSPPPLPGPTLPARDTVAIELDVDLLDSIIAREQTPPTSTEFFSQVGADGEMHEGFVINDRPNRRLAASTDDGQEHRIDFETNTSYWFLGGEWEARPGDPAQAEQSYELYYGMMLGPLESDRIRSAVDNGDVRVGDVVTIAAADTTPATTPDGSTDGATISSESGTPSATVARQFEIDLEIDDLGAWTLGPPFTQGQPETRAAGDDPVTVYALVNGDGQLVELAWHAPVDNTTRQIIHRYSYGDPEPVELPETFTDTDTG